MTVDTADDSSTDVPTSPTAVDGANELDAYVADNDVVLVDFHAEWCGPCKMLEPIVERIATETDAAVAKVDVDDNQALAGQYGVRGVPTLVLFAGGEQVEKVVGVQPEGQLRSLVEEYTA